MQLFFENRYDMLKRNYRHARNMRKNPTKAEEILWEELRKRKLNGYKFRRQHPIGIFILDFYCCRKKLAIELDGAGHFTKSGRFYDNERTNFLNSEGITVLRFSNSRIFNDLGNVLNEIDHHLIKTKEQFD